MKKQNKIIRYIVNHEHRLYENGPVENASVSYNTQLDTKNMSAYSLAIHTACRYFGEISSEHEDGTINLVKSYKRV